jgi:hypothetical protein
MEHLHGLRQQQSEMYQILNRRDFNDDAKSFEGGKIFNPNMRCWI